MDVTDGLLRLRLGIAYDGTDFSGWAIQPSRRTVAGVLTEALEVLLRADPHLVVAGRTDAGVHAIGQVAHIDVPVDALLPLTPRHLRRARRAAVSEPPTPSAAAADAVPIVAEPTDAASTRAASTDAASTDAVSISAESVSAALTGLLRRLAGLLPPDVRVHGARVAPDGFDARFSALRRHYRYRIICSEWGLPPSDRRTALAARRALDPAVMDAAAQNLLGVHDFAAYCKPRPGATTIRHLQSLTVTARPAEIGSGATEIDIDVAADAFCHSMVRSLVGALIAVGQGRAAPGRPLELLRAAARTSDIAVAPARGLTLVCVDYPDDAQLAARAERTRAMRTVADVTAAHDPDGSTSL